MLPVVREYTGTLRFPGTQCFFHKPHSESPARILYVFSDVFQLTELIAGRAGGWGNWGAGGAKSATARGQLGAQKNPQKNRRGLSNQSPAPESAVCMKPQAQSVGKEFASKTLKSCSFQ